VPELPEAETVRLGLAGQLPGRRITAVEATGARSVRRHPDPAELGHRLSGGRVTGVGRHGKYLLVEVDDELLVIHLGMSGQLLVTGADRPAPAHTHVVFRLDDGRELRFVDPRTFGEVFVSAGPAARTASRPAAGSRRPRELAHLGFDPLLEMPSAGAFGAGLAARRMQLKPLLMGQRYVAGLGNIYTDEILHAAGLRPDRQASSLLPGEASRLRTTMRQVLRAAVRLGGSSLSDQQYRDVDGRPGSYQNRHRVYGRDGLSCTTCGNPISRIRWSGRSTFFCPHCQA
jgi:formamidopyrimidine-DNA glycosylase